VAATDSIFHSLSEQDFKRVAGLGRRVSYKAGEVVFTEGDDADHLYLVERGQVSMSLRRFDRREELSLLGPGDCFGEMALLQGAKRSATAEARTDADLWRVEKAAFLDLVDSDPEIAQRIDLVLAERNAALAIKESLLAGCSIQGQNVRISIKGDPSIRESAFTRDRHESAVDRVLDRLGPPLKELLIQRCATEVAIHFNSGEIRISSIFDPFNSEVHPPDKLLEKGYLDRHFPLIGYRRKAEMIHRLYRFIAEDECTRSAPAHVRQLYAAIHNDWLPIPAEELSDAIARLPALRRIPNFYLRNVALGITRDAIRLQFNCDGTHIVDIKDFVRFFEENIS
jgi:CRP-like cAMP-binding protein